MPWAVVEFLESEEVEAVPECWINIQHEDQMCFWPPPKAFKVKDLIVKEAKVGDLPGSSNHKVRVLGQGYNSLELARKKCLTAQETSDLNSEVETGRGCRKRFLKPELEAHLVLPSFKKPKPNEQFTSGSDSEEDDFQPLPTYENLNLVSTEKQNSSPTVIATQPSPKTPDVQSIARPCTSSIICRPPSKQSDESWKAETTRTLAYIKFKLDAVLEILENGGIDRSVNVDDIAEATFTPMQIDLTSFPLETQDEVLKAEEALNDKLTYDNLVKQVSKIGGVNTKETTKRILRKLFSDGLAQHYSFYGFKKKLVFSSLKLNAVIFSGVRLNKASQHATDSEIEGTIKDWLRQAKYRAENKKGQSRNQQAETQSPAQLPIQKD